MASWTQKKLLLTIGGGALGLCLVAGGGIWYSLGLVDETMAEVTKKNEAITAAELKIKRIPNLEKDVVILRENLVEYVKILPDSKELSEFVRMLSQFDRQSGVKSASLLPVRRGEKKGEAFTPIEYSYEMTATLWQCLKFMNLIENFQRFVSITDFSIESGAKDANETRDGDVVHKVKLTMQTYAYNGKTSGKEVAIPEYEDKKKALTDAIWENLKEIRIDTHDFKGPDGRRDVLIDPRQRGDLPGAIGPSIDDQLKVVERNVGEIARLNELQQKIKRQDTTLFEQYSLEKALKDGIATLLANMDKDAELVSFASLKLRWQREVVTPFEEMRGAMDVAAKAADPKRDPNLPLKEMQDLVADLATECNNGQLEAAKERFETVANRMNVAAGDPRHELAVAAKQWHMKATTALDFKGLDLRLQGVVVNRGGRSGVLLNGEVYEEGEYVSDDLLVKMVEEEQVWFVFRGLTLVRTM
jgi:Tfp pilus assembly protein PilO